MPIVISEFSMLNNSSIFSKKKIQWESYSPLSSLSLASVRARPSWSCRTPCASTTSIIRLTISAVSDRVSTDTGWCRSMLLQDWWCSVLLWCRSTLIFQPCGLCVLSQISHDLKVPKAFFPCCFWYCHACTWKTRKKK